MKSRKWTGDFSQNIVYIAWHTLSQSIENISKVLWTDSKFQVIFLKNDQNPIYWRYYLTEVLIKSNQVAERNKIHQQ